MKRLIAGLPLLLAAALVACGGAETTPEPSASELSATPTPTSSPTSTATLTPTLSSVPSSSELPSRARVATVTSVVDGDTFDVSMQGVEYRVRLILVDAPEATSSVECFGREAAAYVNGLVGPGSTVYLEQDVSETDRYGRLLRYVYGVDGRMVNEALVSNGYAVVATFPPDVKHLDRLRAAEGEARSAGRGLWSACTQPAAVPPTVAPGVATATPPRSVTPQPSPTPTPTPTPPPTATATATQAPPSAPVITAFCNAGVSSLEECSSRGTEPLTAVAGWSIWATNVRDWDSVSYQLDGGSLQSQDGFTETFSRLAAGDHVVRIVELRGSDVLWSASWLFSVTSPAPTFADYAEEQCAMYTQGYLDGVAARAASHYLNWLLGEIERWCP